MRGVVMVMVFAACGENRRTATPDAENPDSAIDAPIDSPIDSAVMPPDSAPDAAPDAAPPSMCSAPETLIDVSPRRLGNLALSGNTLYASAFQLTNSTVSNATVFSIDLTTLAVDPSPLPTTTSAVLYTAGEDVLVVDGGGTITRLHPGEQPQVLIENRPKPRTATIDDGFLYWTEENPTLGQPALVRRRLISGGEIENVMTCEDPFEIRVIGPNVWCAGRAVTWAPKVGGTPPDVIGFSDQGFFVPAMIQDGNSVYFVNSKQNRPTLYEAPLPPNIATMISQLTVFGRYTGLVATPSFIYAVANDSGLWRIDRTTHAAENVYNTVLLSGRPILWNGKFFLQSATLTSSGTPLIVHCLE